jgi:hypothetical protein
MKISFESRISVMPDVLMQEIGGESVILNLASERYYGLDDVGTKMWAAITTRESIQEAYEALLAHFDVDAERLRNDLQELIEKLVENGLVEVKAE